jgi:signal peptidase I
MKLVNLIFLGPSLGFSSLVLRPRLRTSSRCIFSQSAKPARWRPILANAQSASTVTSSEYLAETNVTATFPSYIDLMNLSQGEFAASEPFSCGSSRFCVKLYPRGGGDSISLFPKDKNDEKLGIYLQYLPATVDETVDATFALRLKGRQSVGRKFDVEWKGGMRFVDVQKTNLAQGSANDFGAHIMQTRVLKEFLGVSDDALDDPTPVTAEIEVTLHGDPTKSTETDNQSFKPREENKFFFGAFGGDIRTPPEGCESAHDLESVRIGKVVVPILSRLAERPRMFEIGAYPGVEYRILRILKDGKERFSSCPGAEYELKPIYPLVQQLERPWPVTVNEEELPKLYTPAMYNAVSAIGALFTAVFGLLTAFCISQAVSLFFIPSRSMDPTLQVGDVLLVEKVTPRLFHQQKVGDVVLFSPPTALRDIVASNGGRLTSRDLFVKRIAAQSGDSVSVEESGKVRINDQPTTSRRDMCEAEPLRLIEKYLKPKEEVLGSDQVFVMGDCSSVSIDSRVWGPLKSSEIVGKPILRIWPMERFGSIPSLPIAEADWSD